MKGIESTKYESGIRTTNYEDKNIFMMDNRFIDIDFKNEDAYPVELKRGMIIARNKSTLMAVELDSGKTDGREIPVGILAANYVIEDGETKSLRVCVAGEVDATGLVFATGDDLDTVIGNRTLHDSIMGDTAGIVLINVDELGKFDNQ